MTHATKTASNYGIPVAIVIAGILIAGAIFWSTAGGFSTNPQDASARQAGADFRLPSEADHMRGNTDAKVTIVEFSDFECPFCAQLHPTLERIVEENKDVKWVYRHFPLSSIHVRAHGAAIASECAAKLGGNDAFWTFADGVFADQRALGTPLYEKLATDAGIESSSFKACLADKSIASLVSEDGDEAIQAGGRGTPFAVVVTASGRLMPFSGALPYEQLVGLVDQALTN
ncbi:MAG: DsbA family protein [Nitrososphaera sp.]|nr:DsbA family protein [Nitrososphaera sp.]